MKFESLNTAACCGLVLVAGRACDHLHWIHGKRCGRGTFYSLNAGCNRPARLLAQVRCIATLCHSYEGPRSEMSN